MHGEMPQNCIYKSYICTLGEKLILYVGGGKDMEGYERNAYQTDNFPIFNFKKDIDTSSTETYSKPSTFCLERCRGFYA